jgi:transcriptional regulator with XRE-family HTH domain
MSRVNGIAPPKVADKVRGITREKHITGVDIAHALDISRNAVWRRLAGRVAFTDQELLTLAGICGVPVAAFFEGVPVPDVQRARSEGVAA